ncbi:hypothetical protein CD30_06670 [Ureibacillus massiliensis 4400831 = CIP 108448 = CCUG 49529]|uniref:Acetaldehyde dehydrogenase n=1 Tax=Ureibacillus massiliensis 4400831 = CIP 108448 = CCUG 49529 TaxID=1211035 RepID=A0A0A3J2T5_9BACL|nr:DUF779 domain-containing protein [Ureibacillus massiliensis]KGR91304.1 hypothetical protein CD30_06670 [Ureibacillus massiliensis 4400831 = CIP 108448 = CCUG 49529]
MEKVVATAAAKELIKQLQKQHGELVFIHSEGCCDGTSPICMTAGDFYLGSRDEQIGMILDVPYYMHTSNFSYWQHLQIIIDVVDGLGNSFSLESSMNKSFIIQAKKLEM